MCFYADDDDCTLVRDTHPTARKGHTCGECRGAIEPGERYHRVAYVTDGTAGTWVECSRCEALRAMIAEIEHGRGCYGSEAWCPAGDLADAIVDDRDHYGLLDRDDDADVDYVKPAAAHLFPGAAVVESF